MLENIEVRQCGECDFVGFSIELQEHLAQTGHKRLGFFQEITREIFGPADGYLQRGSIQQDDITKEIPILCSGCGNRSRDPDIRFYCDNCLDRSARLANHSTVVKMLLRLWLSLKLIDWVKYGPILWGAVFVVVSILLELEIENDDKEAPMETLDVFFVPGVEHGRRLDGPPRSMTGSRTDPHRMTCTKWAIKKSGGHGCKNLRECAC